MRTIIAYYRVSTKRQGRSGLGLDAQQAAVDSYRRETGCRLLAAYKEVETGKSATRPELDRAIAHARRSGATLVVAKLDRLARNAAFLLTLQASGLPMLFLDLPGANEFTIGIMALVAQHEAKLISERTKAALAQCKKRGVLLGGRRPECNTLTDSARAKGRKVAAAVISAKALGAYADLAPVMQTWRQEGDTFADIADRLNGQGHTTRRGMEWNPTQVMRVLDRVA